MSAKEKITIVINENGFFLAEFKLTAENIPNSINKAKKSLSWNSDNIGSLGETPFNTDRYLENSVTNECANNPQQSKITIK